MEYKVVEGDEVNAFNNEINEQIKNGWTLQGGVAFNSYSTIYLQALIKNTESLGGSNKRKQKTKRSRIMKKRRTLRK
jgi:hypothetical protein